MSPKNKVPEVPVVVDPSALSYNLKQLGAVLGLTEWQARTLVWEGRVPALRCGRNYIVRRADVEAYLANAATLQPCTSKWMQKRQAARSKAAA
jgi:excisionase family DNA binding protein